MNSPVIAVDYDKKIITAIVDGKEHIETYEKLILRQDLSQSFHRLKVLN